MLYYIYMGQVTELIDRFVVVAVLLPGFAINWSSDLTPYINQ